MKRVLATIFAAGLAAVTLGGTANAADECGAGWDGSTNPPVGTLSEFPFANTTGLCKAEWREGLRKISGNYTAQRGEVLDRVEITGSLNASAGNVTVTRSFIRGGVDGGAGDPAILIYNDISNKVKGSVKAYRNNVYGGPDVSQSNKASVWEWHENFMHGRGGGSEHNDTNQVNGDKVVKVVYDHNTMFAWEGGSKERRDGGPRWSGTSALNAKGSGGEAATSNIMWGDAAAKATGVGTSNLFRGYASCHVNIQAGTLTLNGNTFYQNETAKKRSLCGKASDPNAVIIK